MFVCMIQLQLSMQKIDEAIQLWNEWVLPELKNQKGWKNAAFSVSRETGEVRIFTLWETKAQAHWFESTDRSYAELSKLLALGVCKATRIVYRLGDAEITELFGQGSQVYFN